MSLESDIQTLNVSINNLSVIMLEVVKIAHGKLTKGITTPTPDKVSEVLDFPTVQKKAIEYIKIHGREAAVSIFERFGVKRLVDAKPEDLKAMSDAFEVAP